MGYWDRQTPKEPEVEPVAEDSLENLEAEGLASRAGSSGLNFWRKSG